MANYFKFQDEGFSPATVEEARFINLAAPSQDELIALARDLDIPYLFLADPLDPGERPRVDQENGVTLVIVRVPLVRLGASPNLIHDEFKFHGLPTIPVGIIVKDGLAVVVCSDPFLSLELLGRITRKPRPKSVNLLLFKILMETSTDFLHHLERLEDETDRLELNLPKAQQNEEIMTLLAMEKTLIHYGVALKSNRGIMEKLLGPSLLSLDAEELYILERVLTENQQAIFMADIFGQVLGSMGDAFGTIISNNLNKVVKFLTGITIILMLPTFIVGLYGMNVRLPIEKEPWAFWALLVLCVCSCALLWLFFSRKKWV
ncbi:MAG: magnesium transporter CorA family protein [Deltaproteobacteria bacterium]|jgi:magnesium transporter|nr:magnesium transporter CorA family protein [Deltaproteobacteria bacterium]